jgi:acyl-coenzyme A synthetase/AMP-(fatty) acid ligase
MVPKQFEVMKELPKTSSGKVDYPALRRREGL